MKLKLIVLLSVLLGLMACSKLSYDTKYEIKLTDGTTINYVGHCVTGTAGRNIITVFCDKEINNYSYWQDTYLATEFHVIEDK